MTQIEQIKAEIEKQRQLIWPRNTGEMRVVDVPKPFEQGWLNALKWMENLINSLPQEPVGEELEAAAEMYYQQEIEDTKCHHAAYLTYAQGYEDALLRTKDTFKSGANWQKEKMMKDAKEGIVTDKGDFIKFMDGTWVDLDPTVGNTPAFSLKEGQNVKLIVIKED